MWIIIFLIVTFILYTPGLKEAEEPYYEFGFQKGSSLIGLIIGFACGNKCISWATKIKKSKNWAFFIGFFFGLFGLLGYWIYCRKKIRGNKK